jgi:hypothetical protein
MARDDSPSAGRQIDRLVMPLFALLLILGIISFVSIFTDHFVFGGTSLTGQVVGSGFDAGPAFDVSVSAPVRFELLEAAPRVMEAGAPVFVNLYGKGLRTDSGLITVNIYDKPYFTGSLVMSFKAPVQSSTHVLFNLPSDLEPGNYFISVGEGNRESLREGITLK